MGYIGGHLSEMNTELIQTIPSPQLGATTVYSTMKQVVQ